MKDYPIQNPDKNKHRQHNKGTCKIQKRSDKFNPKIWAYFNKSWEIGKNTVAIFLRQLENLGNKTKTQKKPAHINTLENMEAEKLRITENIIFIVHSVHGKCEGAINLAYHMFI